MAVGVDSTGDIAVRIVISQRHLAHRVGRGNQLAVGVVGISRIAGRRFLFDQFVIGIVDRGLVVAVGVDDPSLIAVQGRTRTS